MSDRIVSKWEHIVANNPQHSIWYRDRFRQMAAQGADLAGEARMIDAMVPRGSRILDLGCGGGRLGGYLHRQGHHVTGIDIDPVLIEAAHEDHPGPIWLVDDLVTFALTVDDSGLVTNSSLNSKTAAAEAAVAEFDVVVSAGNVLTFLADGSHGLALRRTAAHLAPEGRAVFGFGLERGYHFDQFTSDLTSAGLKTEVLLSSWDLRPFDSDSGFLVAICSRS